MDRPIRRKSGRLRLRRETWNIPCREDAQVRYPAGLRWMCIRCTRSCRDLPRRTRNILLAESDIKRITNGTKLMPEEFSIPSRGSFPYLRRMRKIGGRCIFLRESRCSIYRARPLICRFYPFSLQAATNKTFDIGFDSSCSGIGRGPHRNARFFSGLMGLASKELESH
jgi:Fe-S-cluster containining protein